MEWQKRRLTSTAKNDFLMQIRAAFIRMLYVITTRVVTFDITYNAYEE